MDKRKFDQDVVFESYLRRSGTGEPLYAPAQILKGFSYGKTKTVRDNNGIEVISDKTLLLVFEDIEPKVQDRVTCCGESRIVLQCEILPTHKIKSLKHLKIAQLEL